MAEFITAPVDDSPPPPAYEFSQQEFDQKTSAALERSLADPPRQDDLFEEWDDKKFAAAQAAYRDAHAVQPTPGSGPSQPQQPHLGLTQVYTGVVGGTHGHGHGQASSFNNYVDSHSPTTSTAPLNLSRAKSPQSIAGSNQRMSWQQDTGYNTSSTSTSSTQSLPPLPSTAQLPRRQLPNPVGGQPLPSSQFSSGKIPISVEQQSTSSKLADHFAFTTIPEDEFDQAPPPPFALVDNSLDGPAYEHIQSLPGPRQVGSSNDHHSELNSQHGDVSPQNSVQVQGVVMRYNGPDLSSSPPPSPPQSPIQVPLSQGGIYAQTQPQYQADGLQHQSNSHVQPLHQQHHRSMPPPPRQRISSVSPRPVSVMSQRPQPRQKQEPPPLPLPRMEFDPSVAYSKPLGSVFGSLPTDTPGGSASALYNSAVVSHLAPRGPRQPSRYNQQLSTIPQTYANPQTQYQPNQAVYNTQFMQQSLGENTFNGGGVMSGPGNRTTYYPSGTVSPVMQYPANMQTSLMTPYNSQQQRNVSPMPVQGQQVYSPYYPHG